MIAPEGKRSGHGRLQEARDGLAYIALRTGAPVVPVAVSGTERFWANLLRLRKTNARIEIGEMFRLEPPDGQATRPRREDLQAMTREAMYRLARLLPERNRGAYADLHRATVEYLRFDGDA